MYTHYSMKDSAPNFGSYACELCNSVMAGERYDYVARDVNEDIVELSICVDCVFDVIDQCQEILGYRLTTGVKYTVVEGISCTN